MKKFKKIITISALAIFSFFASIFFFNDNVGAVRYDSTSYLDYVMYETTLPNITMYKYTYDSSTKEITIDNTSAFTVDLKFVFLHSPGEGDIYYTYSYELSTKRAFKLKGIHSTSNNFQEQMQIPSEWGTAFDELKFLNDLSTRTIDSVFDTNNNFDLVNYIFISYDVGNHGINAGVLDYLIYPSNLYESMKLVNDNPSLYILDVSSGYKSTDNEEAINDYIQNNNMKTEEEYNDYGESKYEEGKQAGIDSVDITTDNQEYADNYIKENNYHTDEDYLEYGKNKKQEGFAEGANSVDIDAIKKSGYDEGYEAGKAAGIASVDITVDNEEAINKYIQDNNLKTEEEYNSYGESKYAEGKQVGIDSVDITSDNDRVIIKYIQDNNMKTLEEYNSYGESMYNQGKADGIASVDITSDNEAAINKYIQDNNLKTKSEYLEYGNQKYFDGYTAGAKSVDTESYRLIGYKEGYEDGVASVDITIDNQDAIDDYIKKNNMKTNADYLSYGETKYNEGLAKGTDNVYNNLDSDEVVKEYVIQYIKVNKYYTEKEFIDNYDDGYKAGYQVGYSKGLGDIESIRKKEYQDGYDEGYKVGFANGESSVDITTDNDEAIDIYIKVNKYHTDYEFNLNYDLGMRFGINYVYNNLDVDLTIQEYVKNYIEKNNYYTEKEFLDNYASGYTKGYKLGYNEGYTLGKNSGGQVITDEVLVETMKEKLLNNLTIDLKTIDANIGSILIKKYDINVENNGDTKITIHYEQPDYKLKAETVVEVVPGENTIIEKENNNAEIISLVVAGAVVIAGIALLIALLSSLGSKSKKKKIYTKKKDYLMKI